MSARNERYVLTWSAGRFAGVGTYYTPSLLQTLQTSNYKDASGAIATNLDSLVVASGICVGADGNNIPYNAVTLYVVWTKVAGGTTLNLKLSGKNAKDTAFRPYVTGTVTAGVRTLVPYTFATTVASFATEPIKLLDGYFQVEAAITGAAAASDSLVIRPTFGII